MAGLLEVRRPGQLAQLRPAVAVHRRRRLPRPARGANGALDPGGRPRHRCRATGCSKHSIERPRPDIADQISGWSYPSGHAMEIAAAMSVLIILTLAAGTSTSAALGLVALWVAIALLVGCRPDLRRARTIPSDVVGGLPARHVLTFVFVVSRCSDRRQHRPRSGARERPLSTMPEQPFRTLAVILNPIKIRRRRLQDQGRTRCAGRRVGRAAVVRDDDRRRRCVDGPGRRRRRRRRRGGGRGRRHRAGRVRGDGRHRASRSASSRLGTGNLLARNLGIPLAARPGARDASCAGRTAPSTSSRIEGDGLGPTRFVVMAGLGLDAAIMAGAPDALKAQDRLDGVRRRRRQTPALPRAFGSTSASTVRRAGTPPGAHGRDRQRRHPAGRHPAAARRPDRRRAARRRGDRAAAAVRLGRAGGCGSSPRRRRTDERLDRYTGKSVVLTTPNATPRQLDGDTVGAGKELRAEIEPGLPPRPRPPLTDDRQPGDRACR